MDFVAVAENVSIKDFISKAIGKGDVHHSDMGSYVFRLAMEARRHGFVHAFG